MSDRLEGKEVDMWLMYTGAALASVLFCIYDTKLTSREKKSDPLNQTRTYLSK